jgi:type II secretory pathway pseudopilin PulG
MKAAMAHPFAASRDVRSQTGQSLIEVIVSAAVLAILALAILAGVDGAQSSSGREKARSVAASLAEKDQERMRSTPVQTLAAWSLAAPAAVATTVDGATYTVTSTVAWVRDDTGGTASCGSDSRDSDYLHINTTVTSAIVGANVAPVSIDAIVAPNIEYSTTHGSLGVKVLDAKGNPLVNKMVTIAGPTPATGQTNTVGCAYFQQILAGSYTIGLNTPGLVDHFGATNVTRTFEVAPGVLNILSVQYDFPATATVAVQTYKPGAAATSTPITSYATRVSTVNSSEVGMLRNFPPAAPLAAPGAASISAPSLFPFTSAYVFFTGTCQYANPAYYTNADGLHPANPTYFSSYAGSLIATASTTTGVTVLQPPINYRLTGKKYAGSTNMSGLAVTLDPQTPASDSCVEPNITGFSTYTVGANNGYVARSLAADGTTLEAGAPYGQYSLCFYDSGSNRHYTDPVLYDNTIAPTGQTAIDGPGTSPPTNSGSSWSSGAC